MKFLVIVIFVCSLSTVGLALRYGWASRLALDEPNFRSLHTTPTPRVGGLLTLPWALFAGLLLTGEYRVTVLLAAVLCGFSFVDDRVGLSAGLRLLAHLTISAAAVFVLDVGGWLFVAALTLALAWMINLFNFMDGADGLSGGMAAIGFAAYGVAATIAGNDDLSLLSFCVVAAVSGFLAFNFSPARIFMGDAGSTTLGFLAGALGIVGWLRGVWPLWFPALVFSPFVVDATVTLIQRALRREKIWQAHREHSYQKLVRMGWSHRRLAIAEYALMFACAGAATALMDASMLVVLIGLGAAALVYALIIVAVGVKWRTFQKHSGQ